MDSLKVRIDVHIELLKLQLLFELKLDEQGLTFDTIFQQAPIGIAISRNSEPFFPGTDNVVQINPEFEKITGRTKEELTKLGWAKITHPDDLEQDMENFKKLQSGEIKSYSMEKRYIRPDDSIVWVDLVVASLSLSNERKNNHICLAQDISERKILEKELLESERSKSVFLSSLPGMAYRCKYDCNWTMQFASAGCFELTGYTPEWEQIPLMARIISVVETYERVLNRGDISVSESKKKAIETIKYGAGKQFDPMIAELFVQMIDEESQNKTLKMDRLKNKGI